MSKRRREEPNDNKDSSSKKSKMSECGMNTRSKTEKTMVYFGPFCDLNILLFKTNILIDKMPEHSYFDKRCHGYILEANLLETLKVLVLGILPNSTFSNVAERRLWIWTDKKLNVKILYFHGYRYLEDEMPSEVKKANVQLIKGYQPSYWDWKILPRLKVSSAGTRSF